MLHKSERPPCLSLGLSPILKGRIAAISSNKFEKLHNFDLRPAAAGLLGGSASTLLLHPLDLLKTRQAVHANNSDRAGASKRRAYARVGSAVREVMLKEGGVRGLYAGVGANVAVSGASWGIYFTTYGFLRSRLQNDASDLDFRSQFMASVGAGAATTLITNPLNVVRTRLVMKEKGSSAIGTLVDMLRREGARSLYKGLFPSLLGVSHGAVQFMAYERIKQNIQKGKDGGSGKLSTVETLCACSTSKLFAAVLTYPCQNVRACQQASSASSKVTAWGIFRRQGIRGLYRGIVPYLMHVVPNVCTVFIVYETVMGNNGGGGGNGE